ncbi:hypothetical protein PoB_007249000 [Plakobranchus ocellatus]|uniref:Uncharacterized protein n=1 Tax=Plakobranchus ocellatus TaxID=259542 RepID=A0AAV4DPC9_9GAST|nr:hypothetical protein PoB_007249000 [Plakobranchus ocellatus]
MRSLVGLKKIAPSPLNVGVYDGKKKEGELQCQRVTLSEEMVSQGQQSDRLTNDSTSVKMMQKFTLSLSVSAKTHKLSVAGSETLRIDKDQKEENLKDHCTQLLIPRLHRPFFEKLKTRP